MYRLATKRSKNEATWPRKRQREFLSYIHPHLQWFVECYINWDRTWTLVSHAETKSKAKNWQCSLLHPDSVSLTWDNSIQISRWT